MFDHLYIKNLDQMFPYIWLVVVVILFFILLCIWLMAVYSRNLLEKEGIETVATVEKYRYLHDSDEPCMTFWFVDQSGVRIWGHVSVHDLHKAKQLYPEGSKLYVRYAPSHSKTVWRLITDSNGQFVKADDV